MTQSPFDFQPELVGTLIRMRPMEKADFDALYHVASDPLIWAQHTATDRWKRDVFQSFFETALADQGGLLAISKQSGEIIGHSRYSQMFMGDEEIEIGWTFLARSVWGGAHNRDMKQIMLAHALKAFPRALFRVAVDNHRSRGAMEKLGGHLIDWSAHVSYGGIEHAYIAYEITRANFAAWPTD